jgi:hypothetical protein
MSLPNNEQRWIPDAKVHGYCLGGATEKSRSRKKFFEMFGFGVEQWQLLSNALM